MNLRFFLRWSLRDARERWLLVISIALITALGTAVFSAFGNQREWRVSSLDRSYEMLNMYDLRLELTEGSFVAQSDITAALSEVDGVTAVETRLLVPTLMDASQDGETILYPGRIVGLDVSDNSPHINKLNVSEGRNLTAADNGENTVVIDYLFTRFRELQLGTPIQISGGIPLNFVGRGQTPENFMLIPAEGGLGENENTFAVMYMSLESVQNLSGRTGLVNDILLDLDEDANLNTVEADISAILDRQFDDVGFTFTRQADDPVMNAMYTDANGDQRIWNIIGGLFLLGAALATFNLAGRIVEAQRRQIGIGMALGVPRHWLAFRPLLLGLQIAVLGTVFGLILSYPLIYAIADMMRDFYPLPYWSDPFYVESYLLGAVLGIIIPLLATLYPVVRAVRVQPIDAIQTGYLVAKGGGLAPLLEWLPMPGRSFAQMPVRNILRSPWRTLLTLIGVSIAIFLLVGMSGLLDTFNRTLDQVTDFYLNSEPDRLNVILDAPYAVDAERVTAIENLTDDAGNPLVEKVDVGMLMMGKLVNDDTEIGIGIELYDPQEASWQPNLRAGNLSDGKRGIVISQKAADELGVEVGDTVTLVHPARQNMFTYRMVETELPLLGIHSNPLRPLAYMSLNQADLMGMAGLTNMLTLYPANGVRQNDIRRALFREQGIASIQAVKDLPDSFEEVLSLFNSMLVVVRVIAMVMAFLIAFNSTSINIEERAREIATMFAFGLPVRTVLRMQIVENLITGVLGTMLGIGFGYVIVIYMINGQVEDMMPDINFTVYVSTTTLFYSGILGVLVVALTPLLSLRRMWHMNIPSRLRVLE